MKAKEYVSILAAVAALAAAGGSCLADITVPAGYRAEMYLQDSPTNPLWKYATALTFGPQGELYICGVDWSDGYYDNPPPGTVALARDSDGNGEVDTVTDFTLNYKTGGEWELDANEMYEPLGIAVLPAQPGDGPGGPWVFVSCRQRNTPPQLDNRHIVRLRDTDGDGVADVKDVVATRDETGAHSDIRWWVPEHRYPAEAGGHEYIHVDRGGLYSRLAGPARR